MMMLEDKKARRKNVGYIFVGLKGKNRERNAYFLEGLLDCDSSLGLASVDSGWSS